MTAANVVRRDVELESRPSAAPVSGVRTKSRLTELMREVQRVAHDVCRRVPEHVREDVESAAMLGLMEALRHVDEMNADQFTTYLHACVREALRAEAQHFDPLSRVERHLVRRVEFAVDEYRRRYGKEPELDIVAREVGCDEGDCRDALTLLRFSLVPLNDEPANDGNVTPEDAFAGSYAVNALRWALAQLDGRERLVLRLAYKRGMPLADIARRLGVSTPRIHKIRVESERKLERLLRRAPALKAMPTTRSRLDWDDCTGETLRERSWKEVNKKE